MSLMEINFYKAFDSFVSIFCFTSFTSFTASVTLPYELIWLQYISLNCIVYLTKASDSVYLSKYFEGYEKLLIQKRGGILVSEIKTAGSV